ncbi:MAG: hemerythrin domain-containing protein [Armatimonadota bacterium]
MIIEQVATETEYGALGPPERIVSYLLEEHHGYLRRELPALLRLMRRVQREECNLAVRSKLEELIELFKVFRYNQFHHMDQEEREIFPGLLNGLAGESLERAVQIISREHQTFRFVFERFYEMLNVIEKELLHCKSYRPLRDRLTALAERSKEHIWLEEQLLAMLLVAGHDPPYEQAQADSLAA